MARPTKFSPKFAAALLKYFGKKPYIVKKGQLPKVSDFPTLAGFAIEIGVHRDTLHEWANSKTDGGTSMYPEFSDAYKRAKDFQERYLLVNGMRELIHPSFAIFTAKNVLGFRDKHKDEADVVINNNVSNLDDEQLNKKIEEKMAKLGMKNPKEGK